LPPSSAPAPGGAPAAAAPGYAAQAPAAPAGAPAAAAGAGGFFRNAAAIGAGVLGGNLLFQGIESLLHGGNRGGGFLSGTNAPTEIIENNYYYSDSDSNRSLPAADVNDDRGGSFLNTSDDSGPLDDFGSDDDSSMI
jgi:hypothetical protein